MKFSSSVENAVGALEQVVETYAPLVNLVGNEVVPDIEMARRLSAGLSTIPRKKHRTLVIL
jgi:hypothetical protein